MANITADDYKEQINDVTKALENINVYNYDEIKGKIIPVLKGSITKKKMVASLNPEETEVEIVDGDKAEKDNAPFKLPYLDLEIEFRIPIIEDKDGSQSVKVSKTLRECWDVTSEEILADAISNIKERVDSLPAVLFGMGFDLEDDAENINELYMVSNKSSVNGASSILKREVMNKIADKLGDTFFVIPSSIHEVLCFPYDEDNYDGIKQMIVDINRDVVNETEVLGDHPYIYKKDKGLFRTVEELKAS